MAAIPWLKPALMMVATQILYAGMNILFKLVEKTCMNLNILVAYRLLFSAAIMVPLALILERDKRPPLTKCVLGQSFLCGLLGSAVAQNLYIQSLAMTSPTLAAAIFYNLLPAITFIVSLCFGMEKWTTLLSKFGRAKAIGSLVSIGGAMVFSFVKGPTILGCKHLSSTSANNPVGVLLALASALCYVLSLIIQEKLNSSYPCYYSTTALNCVMGSVQSVIYALCRERDCCQWQLGWDIRLWTAAYSGIVVTGLSAVVISWCMHEQGPLFVMGFTPLSFVIVAVASALILHQIFSLGSLLGGFMIICGLYMVLWGKSQEPKPTSECLLPSTSRINPAHVP